jgi:FkbM family methyltransferase
MAKWLRDLLRPVDRMKYLLWRVSKSKQPVVVRLQDGKRLILRPRPTTDLGTAFEIFISQAYLKPAIVPEPEPKLIVDLGANVGYSVLHWAYNYPTARLVAYEPHPVQLKMLNRHLELNALQNRVEAIGSAVSNHDAGSFLTDDENESVLTVEDGAGRLPVTVRDFFDEMGGQRIDLLKMDIEGGEYPILSDRRFETLDVRTIVMEWHNTDEIPDGRKWCIERFTALNFKVSDGALRYDRAGMLWAWKD